MNSTMKNKLILIGLLLAGLLTAYHFVSPAIAQSQRPTESPENIVLYAERWDGGSARAGQLFVMHDSVSSGAPYIPHYWSGQPIVPLGQALADLRKAGYRIIHISPEARMYVLEK